MKTISVNVDLKKNRKQRRFEKKTLLNFEQKKEKNKKFKKVFLIILGIFFSILLICIPLVYKFLYLPAIELKDAAYSLKYEAEKAKTYWDGQDLVSLQSELSIIDTKLELLREKYDYFQFAKKVPKVSGYYKNGEYVFNSVQLAIPLAENLLTAATPIADVFGYKTSSGTHEEVNGQEKIQTIIRNLPDISAILKESDAQIDEITKNLGMIDPNYIPEKVGDYELKSMFNQVSSTLQNSKSISADLQEILEIAPSLAGVPEKKTYLILFQNDKEIRPTGGFITAFGYAEIENGALGDIVSEDIYNLDKKLYSWEAAPVEISKYLGVYEWHIRDVNIHADLVSASEKFEEMYKNQYRPKSFDGIIYIDTQFVETLMEVVGPIELEEYDETITSENVVKELEMYSEKIFLGGSDRKQFMEDLMGALVSRVIEAQREEWGDLIGGVWESMQSKSVQLYFHDEQAQELASKYGFTGEIPEEVDGDFLYVVDSNMGGLKANFYVTSSVEQEINISDDGSIVKTVKLHWENDEPGDHWLNGPYRNWVRIYVPNGSTFVDGDVFERTINEKWHEKDYNKTIYEAFITVPVATDCTDKDDSSSCTPGTYDLEFTYILPFKSTTKTYDLTIWKQPGKLEEPQTIFINDVKHDESLTKNLELSYEIE